jgi:alkanesulfonate monooxygenase SsuD/methylene tetrahydromethanopterin reductase-like flavin-dependent oxidoreductase (luciferase family)
VVATTRRNLSAVTENDFSVYDLDGPVPELDTNGHKSTLADFFKSGRGRTLKEAASKWELDAFPAVGTPDQVAERMSEVMEAFGGDGYLISNHGETLHRRYR